MQYKSHFLTVGRSLGFGGTVSLHTLHHVVGSQVSNYLHVYFTRFLSFTHGIEFSIVAKTEGSVG